jgi:hypothetical protein
MGISVELIVKSIFSAKEKTIQPPMTSFLRLYMGSKNRIVEKKLVHLAGDTGSFEYTVFGLALHLVA